MKAAGLKDVSRRKSSRTTIRDEWLRPANDLLDRSKFQTKAEARVAISEFIEG